MCGIVGVATTSDRRLRVERGGIVAMRDRLAHRGPDGAGFWMDGWIALGHRRLAVVGLGPDGEQPLASPCGRHVLVYNGELYNDDDVRDELERDARGGVGGSIPYSGDSRTVLRALAAWGTDSPGASLARLRGMYALAWLDRERRRLLLARDPLGIKPLFLWNGATEGGGREIVFASEIPAILAHPSVRTRPDWTTVSAYLTTIRTTLGGRTMFEGVRALQPGEWVEFDLSGPRIVERGGVVEVPSAARLNLADEGAIDRVGSVVRESVARHLRSDVPLCALLSGGLDSTIVCAEAVRRVPGLRTFCAGAREDGAGERGDVRAGEMVIRARAAATDSPDFAFAREAATTLGTTHAEVEVTRGGFASRWAWMVDRLGVPLSTPNEVAIYEVCAALRSAGNVVALSGEGADELFGGYDRLLSAGLAWARGIHGASVHDPSAGGVAALDAAAWVPRSAKSGLLRPAMWEGVERDAALVETYRDAFAGCVAASQGQGWRGEESLMQALLRHQRRVNLEGLLSRLDGASMLAGVEGRTPLADVEIASVAEALPMRLKFAADVAGRSGGFNPADGSRRSSRATTGGTPAQPSTQAASLCRLETKVALRRAFGASLPAGIVAREKASFPLPFQAWMGDALAVLEGSDLVESIFEPAAIDLVRADPGRSWNLAWPMVNLALWGRRWGW